MQGRALLEASALALECGQLDKCERLLGDSRASFADAELSQAKAAACCRAADALMKRVVLCRATLGRGQEVVRQAEKAMAVFDLLSARRLLSSSLSLPLSLSHTHTLSLSLSLALSHHHRYQYVYARARQVVGRGPRELLRRLA